MAGKQLDTINPVIFGNLVRGIFPIGTNTAIERVGLALILAMSQTSECDELIEDIIAVCHDRDGLDSLNESLVLYFRCRILNEHMDHNQTISSVSELVTYVEQVCTGLKSL